MRNNHRFVMDYDTTTYRSWIIYDTKRNVMAVVLTPDMAQSIKLWHNFMLEQEKLNVNKEIHHVK